MKFETNNGVIIDFDNNVIGTIQKDQKPFLVFDSGNNLKEVNLNGYSIQKIDTKYTPFSKETKIRINENVSHIFINYNGIALSDDNGKVITITRESLLEILSV